MAPWQAASKLRRLHPKRLECLVRPDAKDVNFFFPDMPYYATLEEVDLQKHCADLSVDKGKGYT